MFRRPGQAGRAQAGSRGAPQGTSASSPRCGDEGEQKAFHNGSAHVMHVKFDILGKAKRKHLWVCGARDRDKGSDTLSATVGGPWLSIRRESTQGAVQLQHVAVGPGSGDPRSKMIGLGRFRGRDDQGTNTRKWCKFSRGAWGVVGEGVTRGI